RGGHAGGAKQLAADQLLDVTGVLQRVSQVELVHAVKEFVAAELVHVDGDVRLVVDVAEAASRPLEVDAGVLVDDLVALLERRLDVLARLAADRVEFLRPQVERQVQHRVALEELITLLRWLRVHGGRQRQPAQQKGPSPREVRFHGSLSSYSVGAFQRSFISTPWTPSRRLSSLTRAKTCSGPGSRTA